MLFYRPYTFFSNGTYLTRYVQLVDVSTGVLYISHNKYQSFYFELFPGHWSLYSFIFTSNYLLKRTSWCKDVPIVSHYGRLVGRLLSIENHVDRQVLVLSWYYILVPFTRGCPQKVSLCIPRHAGKELHNLPIKFPFISNFSTKQGYHANLVVRIPLKSSLCPCYKCSVVCVCTIMEVGTMYLDGPVILFSLWRCYPKLVTSLWLLHSMYLPIVRSLTSRLV